MAWEREADRTLLLELALTGGARRRTSQEALLSKLEAQGWVTPTPRVGEVALVKARVGDLEQMLDSRWFDWRSVAQALLGEGLDPTPQGLRELRRRQRALPPLPSRLSWKTAAAAVAEHSKASLGPAHLEMLVDVEVVRDGVVLVRPHGGMELRQGEARMPARDLVAMQGVMAITSRALMDGVEVSGPQPLAVMTVENEAAFVDLPKPPGLMLVWVPGWNTRLAVEFLSGLEAGRWLHFGDLDPNGVRIYRHLRERLPRLEHFVPDWWAEVVEAAPPKRAEWPEGLVGEGDHPLVVRLAGKGRVAEQEGIVTDRRLVRELEGLGSSTRPRQEA